MPLHILYFSKPVPHINGGVQYQLADCVANFLQQLFHMALYGTPPVWCVPLLWWRKYPYTSHKDKCSLTGIKSCRSVPSSVEGVAPPSGADKSLLWCAWGVSSNPPLPAVPGALPPLGRPVRLSLCIDVPNPPGRPPFGWPAPPSRRPSVCCC